MSESVKVAVRCRPMSNKELQQGCRNVVTIDPLTKSCTLENSAATGSGKVYQFDAAFGTSATTELVYENVGSVIVEAVLEGYNGTVFAYGQTGCGKSFTMRSFIERALEHLFEATSTASSETRYLALLSYLEIYNERLRDLLQDDTGESLTLKEDPTRGTYVAGGLREVTVKDAAECTALVQQGDQRRAAAATKMNAASSRSHAVLTLSLEAIAINDDDKHGNAIRRGRLHLVDLAGSERQARTGATGDRLKEAASINLSLSALGNVISALAAGNGRHVPYRDSKLTRLLRDSLGGNARTLMIACVSPSDVDAEETLSTLRYAARARCIKNKPVVNEDPKDALLRQYQVELQRLREMLHSSDQSTMGSDSQREADEEADSLREKQYLEEVEKLRKECENSNLSAQKLKEELEALKSRHESGLNDVAKINATPENQVLDELDKERAERRKKKREAAMQDVLKKLEKLTIGGEEIGNTELKKRRERRRKRLEVLVGALEDNDANGSVFQVYGQLRSTEDALKRMTKKVKQLEAEAADLQASWDAERRDLLRRELLTSQLCDLMVPQLRPGCPFRDIVAVRAAATWCDELGRWRLPDVSPHIPLPPAPVSTQRDVLHPAGISPAKADLNNNSNNSNGSNDDDEIAEENNDVENTNRSGERKKFDIADIYFRRRRVDTLLAHAREVKNRKFELGSRLSRSGGSEDAAPIAGGYLQLNALNLQSSAPVLGEIGSGSYSPSQRRSAIRGGWVDEHLPNRTYNSFVGTVKKHPPRILEALPSYPQGNAPLKSSVDETSLKGVSERGLPSRLIPDNDDYTNRHHPFHIGHTCSPTY